MNRMYYSLKNTNDIYYTGEDHRSQPNLINMRTGSEYFLPGYMFDEWELKKNNLTQISKKTAINLVPNPYGNHSI